MFENEGEPKGQTEQGLRMHPPPAVFLSSPCPFPGNQSPPTHSADQKAA